MAQAKAKEAEIQNKQNVVDDEHSTMYQNSYRKDLDKDDRRLNLPRFEKKALESNNKFIETLKEIASGKSATLAQICLAYLFQQGEDVFPIPGTRKISRLEENVAAFDVKLSDEELTVINDRLPIGSTIGSRY